MQTTQIEEKTNGFIEALHQLEQGTSEDAGQLAALFAPDAKLGNASLDIKGTELEGPDQILEFWVEYKDTLGQVESKFHHITVSENSAGLFWVTTGTRPTGEGVEYRGATLLEFDDQGQIKLLRGYYDTQALVVTGH